MIRSIKKIIYAAIFFPMVALAQITSTDGGFENPGISATFSSISGFLYVILGGMGILSIIGLFIAAIDYLAAGGDEERVGRSGRTLAFSLVGLVIAIIGIILINLAKGAIRE